MVLGHQKPSIFAVIVHMILRFFLKPFPECIFRGSKSELSLKRAILERSAISWGAENGPIIPNNISKNDKKGSRANYGDPPGADLGAIWRRKRSKDEFSSIWDRFWVDFRRILEKYRLIFDVVFHDFDVILTYILKRVFTKIHTRKSANQQKSKHKPQPHKPT